MVPLLNVPWQKVQVPVDVCLGMMCPFLAPGAIALTQSVTKRQPQYAAPELSHPWVAVHQSCTAILPPFPLQKNAPVDTRRTLGKAHVLAQAF